MENGYSFTIITGGRRDDLLENLIRGIHRMRIPKYEIIVTGNYRPRPDIIYHPRPEWAAEAEVCRMRNLNCSTARFDKILVLDDDVEFTEDWYENIRDFTNFDMTGCRGIDPGGNRWFDYNWASREDPTIPTRMLAYDEYNDSVYISGYFMMFKRYVWEKVRFDESRKNYQFDDVDFCHRVTDAGFRISIRPGATVIHHVDQRGREVSIRARTAFELRRLPPEKRLYAEGIGALRAGRFSEAADLLKKAVDLVDDAPANYNLGLAYQGGSSPDLAERQYRKVLAMTRERNCGEFPRASLHLHLGEIYQQRRDLRAAEKEYLQVLEYVPDHKKAGEHLRKIRRLTHKI